MNTISSSISIVTSVYSEKTTTTELHSVNQAEQVIDILKGVTSDDLVVFDVDEVLITLKDRFLRPRAADFCDPIFFELFYPLSDERKINLLGEWLRQVEVEVVNQKMVEALRGLQNQGVRTIALTRMIPGPGPCGKIPLMEDFRFSELKERGIDFSQSFSVDRMELDFPFKEGRAPLFKDGILYAHPYRKGKVLKSFLDKIGFLPKKVWFVDNDQKQVDSVAKSMSKCGISYVGIQYLDQLLLEEEFDQQLGEFQFQHFKETGIWPNDQAARTKIK